MSQSATKEIPYSVGKIEVTTPDFSYLQTARVWIMIRPEDQNSCRSPEANPLPLTNLWFVTDTKDLVVTSKQTSSSSSIRRLVRFDVAAYSMKANISICAFDSNNIY